MAAGASHDGAVEFTTAFSGQTTTSAGTAGKVVAATWVHVAVTWDGVDASLYVDGQLDAEQPHPALAGSTGGGGAYFMGQRPNGSRVLIGVIDEVKLSDYVKTSEQIVASMNFDSTELFGQCGDGVSDEVTEICDGQSLCCEPSQCMAATSDPVCSAAGGACSSSVCEGLDAGRITDGLQALWLFDQLTDGATVSDISGVLPALDLVVDSQDAVSQQAGYLTVDSATTLTAAGAGRLIDAAADTEELTLEAWVRPANVSQEGPARVVSMSADPDQRNFMIGQHQRTWIGRVRVTEGSANGHPSIASAQEVTTDLTHVVLVASQGERRLYVDGRLRDLGVVDGGFGNWDGTFPLLVGNEATGTRAWLGDLHLIAIYNDALTELEVAQNYAAGADPEI